MHKHQSYKICEANTDKLQGETDISAGTARNFNIPLSTIDRTTGQRIRKDIEELNKTIIQDLINICRTHFSITEHIFFPSTHETYDTITISFFF